MVKKTDEYAKVEVTLKRQAGSILLNETDKHILWYKKLDGNWYFTSNPMFSTSGVTNDEYLVK